MSNNKQSIKLYTEEEIRKFFSEKYDEGLSIDELIVILTPIELPSDSLCINCDDSKSTHNICMDCIIKIGKENIELPSDEEIEEKCNSLDGYEFDSHESAFFGGAKWMRDKIQGGNK